MQGYLAQGLEQDVGAQIEIISERDLAEAAAQLVQHAAHMRLVQPHPGLGELAGESPQQARHDPGCEGDETAEVELARQPAAEIECGQLQLVGMGDQLACLAQQATARRAQRPSGLPGSVAHGERAIHSARPVRSRRRAL